MSTVSGWPTEMATLLFTDIEGSTRLWESHRGEMGEAVRRHDELLSEAVAAHRGRLVKKMGDGVMAVFVDPADAISAGMEAQAALHRESWGGAVEGISVRMGIHTGLVERDGDDVLGPTVNRAARIEQSGHGRQVLVSAATRELVGDRLEDVGFRDLGEHQLRGLSRPERVFQVEASGLVAEFPALRTDSAPTNVPDSLQRMVGRGDELQAVLSALGQQRLVTVTGAGGAGKTTLAMEVARRALSQYPAGVWLVELAGLNDGRRIATECLGAIRRPAAGDRDHGDLLVEALTGQQTLLVFDNCEHLRGDVAALTERILVGAPQVTVLATSREPLSVVGEHVWRIPTLRLPDASTVDGVEASDAGAMFKSRAQSADPGFEVTTDNAGLVAELCERLDGLPLAIDLACARLRSMGLEDLSSRLDDRFKLLRGSTAALPHQQTLSGTVAWSYDLLGEREQWLYRRLSVFAGGFGLEAAEAVGSGPDIGEDDVLDLLDHLVAQSLVQHSNGRYRMLETIRQFGADLLEQHGELGDARDAHLEWMAELAQQGGRQLEGKDQYSWLGRFQREIDNIRAALAHALDDDPLTGAAIMSSLTRFFWLNAMEADTHQLTDSRSYLAEGYDWATELLNAGGDELSGLPRARLQSGIGGMLCVRAGKYQEAVERLAEAQTLFEAAEDPRGLGWAVFYDGIAGWALRPIEETIDRFEQAQHLLGEAEVKGGELLSTLLISFALGVAGRLDEGRLHANEYITGAETTKVPFLTAHAADAATLYDAWQDSVNPDTIKHAVTAVESFRSQNNYACLSHTLGAISMLFARLQDIDAAGLVLGVSRSVRNRLNMVLAPYEDHSNIAAEIMAEVLNQDLTQGPAGTRWRTAIAQGLAMDPDEGIDWTCQRLTAEQPGPH